VSVRLRPCQGDSYTVHGDRVRMLAERAEAGDLREACFTGRTFLDARFELTDGELRLNDPYGSPLDALLLVTRPRERVDSEAR